MTRMLAGSVAVLLGSALSAFAASTSFEITVAVGPHERKNIPVRVPMLLDRIGNENIASVTLTGPDGKAIPAQWTKPSLILGEGNEVHFILPHLSAGETVRLKATLSTDAPSSPPHPTLSPHAGGEGRVRGG